MKVTTADPRALKRGSWRDSPWRIALASVSAALVVILLGLVVIIAVIPRVMGGASLVILSGSMEPTLNPGDLAAVRGVHADEVCTIFNVGDILTYHPKPNDPTLITHRVIGKTAGTFDDGSACRIIVQGDANNTPDDPVAPAQVVGKFMYGIPKLGWVQNWLGQRSLGLPVGNWVFVAVAVFGATWGLSSLFSRPRTRVIALDPATGQVLPAGAVPADLLRTTGVDGEVDPEEVELRRRELAIREREIALKEAEFAERRARHAAPPLEPHSEQPDSPEPHNPE